MEPDVLPQADGESPSVLFPFPTGSQSRNGTAIRCKDGEPLEGEIANELMDAEINARDIPFGDANDDRVLLLRLGY